MLTTEGAVDLSVVKDELAKELQKRLDARFGQGEVVAMVSLGVRAGAKGKYRFGDNGQPHQPTAYAPSGL